MRLIFGMIIGAALTVGGAYIADAMAGMRRVLEAKRRLGSKIEVEWQFLVHAHNAHEQDAARRFRAMDTICSAEPQRTVSSMTSTPADANPASSAARASCFTSATTSRVGF